MKAKNEKKANLPKKAEARKAEQMDKNKKLEQAEASKTYTMTLDSKLADKDVYNVGATISKENELLGFQAQPDFEDFDDRRERRGGRGRGGRGGRGGDRGGRGGDRGGRGGRGGEYRRERGPAKHMDQLGDADFPTL